MAVSHYGELIIHFYFVFLRCPMAKERQTHSPEKSNDSLQTWELWAWGNKRVGFATLEPHIKPGGCMPIPQSWDLLSIGVSHNPSHLIL